MRHKNWRTTILSQTVSAWFQYHIPAFQLWHFQYYVWHERHGIICLYSNLCLCKVFTKLLLCWPKRVQQLHERYSPESTCTIYLFHTFLQCLILGIHAAVDGTIEDLNSTFIFEVTVKDLCHSTTNIVCFMSNRKGYFPIIPVSINPVELHIKCLWYFFSYLFGWIHINSYLLHLFTITERYLFYQPSKPITIYLVAWHDRGIITDKPCHPRKFSLVGFRHHRPKALCTSNAIRYHRYNIIIVVTKTCQ